jgi:hypothetical protein
MAFYLKLAKVAENDTFAEYSFSPDDIIFGRLKIYKKTGDPVLMQPLDGDDREDFFIRAAAKLRKEWRAGVLPEFTEWAS